MSACIKTVDAGSTNYYKRNRETKQRKYQCIKCDYVTFNSKAVLNNHINAKHVLEKDRPFQCTENKCKRGFSQKAHLIKHLEKTHSTTIQTKKHVIYYKISLTDNIPCSKKIRNRIKFYRDNNILSGEDLYNKKYKYDANGGDSDGKDELKCITLPLLKYDCIKKYIKFTTMSVEYDREKNKRGRYGY
jgi:hypothetical protein